MDIDGVFWFRLFNVALTVFVVLLGFMKLAWKDPDRGRQLRISGLCVLGIVAALNAYDRRFENFSIRIPLHSLGLILSAIGLHLFHIDRHKEGKTVL